MADTATPQQPTAPAPRRQDIPAFTLEVDDRRNGPVLFGPLQETLRGRYEWQNWPRGTTSERGLASVPNLPGLYITVDPAKRTAKVEDPLAFRENAELLRTAQPAYEAVIGHSFIPRPSIDRRFKTRDELATWLYWCRRLLDDNLARLVKGQVPTIRELARLMPDAKIRRRFFDSLEYRKEVLAGSEDVAAIAQESGDEDEG
jgi:hypothetical protein